MSGRPATSDGGDWLADDAIPDFLVPLSGESLITVSGEPPLTGVDF